MGYSELQTFLWVPVLTTHPLLKQLAADSNITMYRITAGAITQMSLARNDQVFHPGEKATHMDIVVKGKLKYEKLLENSMEFTHEWVDGSEDWISEPVLWAKEWTHIGGLIAVTESDMIRV